MRFSAPLWVALVALGLAAAPPWPLSVPERTDFRRTSTVAEVQAFMEALRQREPALSRYAPKGAPRATESGKPLLAWRLAATGKAPVRVYVNANIHAGEAEGKEAIQQVFRELLQGQHPAIRRGIDLVALPCYNADGTDALDPAIRPYQPNPEESGVGRRENAFGLDLNRDLMKAEAANTRWFLAMLQDFDPAAVFDLHTTNGSTHGFFLTHGPAMTTGADEALLAFNRRMLVEVRERLNAEGLPTYDYGNFRPYRPTQEKPPVAWETYDAHPRLLTNYPALQGRLAVLSEAYVYRTWPQRIDDTRRFVLACLEWIAAHPAEVHASRTAAAARWTEAWKAGPPSLPLSAVFKEVERYPFDWVDPIRDAQGRIVGEKSRTRLVLPSFVGFEGRDSVMLPRGYLVDAAYSAKIKDRLLAHGVKVFPGRASSAAATNGSGARASATDGGRSTSVAQGNSQATANSASGSTSSANASNNSSANAASAGQGAGATAKAQNSADAAAAAFKTQLNDLMTKFNMGDTAAVAVAANGSDASATAADGGRANSSAFNNSSSTAIGRQQLESKRRRHQPLCSHFNGQQQQPF